MGLKKLLAPPAVAAIVFFIIWYTNRITIWNALFVYSMLNLGYFVVKAFKYGLLFHSCKITETQLTAFTFYYKEYNCKYSKAKSMITKDFREEDIKMLKSQPDVQYMEIYLERTRENPYKNFGRILAGYALREDAAFDVGIKNVLQEFNFKKTSFDDCNVIQSSLKKIDELSKGFAFYKLSQPIWDYVASGEKETSHMFLTENKITVSCGVFKGKEPIKIKEILEDRVNTKELLEETKSKKEN